MYLAGQYHGQTHLPIEMEYFGIEAEVGLLEEFGPLTSGRP